ncbi:MAG: ABC transporter substrate-binding protein [Thermodesulfobacteriota bacterium]
MKKNGTLGVFLLALIALMWVGLGGAVPTAEAKVVKIGILAPLTGPASADGEDYVRAVEWAVDEVNKGGGIAGNTFEVETADVKDMSAANVTSAVERLLGMEDVHFIITGYASLSNFEIDLMKEAGMPFMIAGPAGSTEAIISPAPEDYWCCWSFTASFKGYETELVPLVEKLAADKKITLKNRKVAIISSDNPYSKTISEGMKEVFKKGGWTVTVDELVPYGEVSDWRASLAKVRQDPPDLVVNTDYLPGNSALFLNQFLEAPTDSLVFLQYAPLVPEFLKLTGDKANGVLFNAIGQVLNTPKWPLGPERITAFRARYNTEPGPYGIGLYDMMQFYFAALRQVGDPAKHQEIGRTIGQLKMEVGAGILELDPATHLAVQDEDHIPVTFFQIWNGQGGLIAPAKYAVEEFKLPPWMKK